MKLKAPWAIAGRVTESVENIFIEIITDQEISGMGAGAPAQDVTGETIQNAFDRLQLMSSKIIGWDLGNKKDLFTQLESELRAFPATRAAIDMALFDALAQSEGKSVVEHLGQVHQCLPTSITIGVESFDKTIEDAKKNIEKGFSILKIKIGENMMKI